MEELKYNQTEMLELINQYNTTPRKIIKANYKRLLFELKIQPKDIMDELGYGKHNVHGWSTVSSPNIPQIDQDLSISIAFDFDVNEFLK